MVLLQLKHTLASCSSTHLYSSSGVSVLATCGVAGEVHCQGAVFLSQLWGGWSGVSAAARQRKWLACSYMRAVPVLPQVCHRCVQRAQFLSKLRAKVGFQRDSAIGWHAAVCVQRFATCACVMRCIGADRPGARMLCGGCRQQASIFLG